ncbi:type IV pilus modification PilV family protein [Ectothiorhodospira shaposhnikovii]|uniref:type IV pilus modification PilV family protein n=1 Tax=Ectothiorhodospira shaposhnikovii TaxID=1054 RepID=UPI001EE8462A|nr:type II secretion system protein [Ectothiorhodospira shaposhnikovii]MCG5514377.1 type II secretion system GspH family protein [Ectothiorhodospira shaposhnikovii]
MPHVLPGSKREQGFTLIEAVIGITLIGIAATLFLTLSGPILSQGEPWHQSQARHVARAHMDEILRKCEKPDIPSDTGFTVTIAPSNFHENAGPVSITVKHERSPASITLQGFINCI